MNLCSRGPRGGLTIDEYIAVYYFSDTEKFGSEISTNSIQVLGLKAILLTLGRIAGLASLQQASRPSMCYVVECMRPIVYDWSIELLSNMKQQLSDCKMDKVQNFSFSSILSMLLFERVQGLSSRVDVPPQGVRDTTQ